MNPYDQQEIDWIGEVHSAKKFLTQQIMSNKEMHWWITQNRQTAEARFTDLARDYQGAMQACNPLLLQMLLWNGCTIQVFSWEEREKHKGKQPHTIICENIVMTRDLFDAFFDALACGREFHLKSIHTMAKS